MGKLLRPLDLHVSLCLTLSAELVLTMPEHSYGYPPYGQPPAHGYPQHSPWGPPRSGHEYPAAPNGYGYYGQHGHSYPPAPPAPAYGNDYPGYPPAPPAPAYGTTYPGYPPTVPPAHEGHTPSPAPGTAPPDTPRLYTEREVNDEFQRREREIYIQLLWANHFRDLRHDRTVPGNSRV
jgi:hypothetical protein